MACYFLALLLLATPATGTGATPAPTRDAVPTKVIRALVPPDCKCKADLLKELQNTSWSIGAECDECIKIVLTPSAGTCTPHCNDSTRCDGDHIGCCPDAGQITISMLDWSCCGGDVSVSINSQSATLSHNSTLGISGAVGGTAMACLHAMDVVESGGDDIVIDCHQAFHCVWKVKDVCRKCPG